MKRETIKPTTLRVPETYRQALTKKAAQETIRRGHRVSAHALILESIGAALNIKARRSVASLLAIPLLFCLGTSAALAFPKKKQAPPAQPVATTPAPAVAPAVAPAPPKATNNTSTVKAPAPTPDTRRPVAPTVPTAAPVPRPAAAVTPKPAAMSTTSPAAPKPAAPAARVANATSQKPTPKPATPAKPKPVAQVPSAPAPVAAPTVVNAPAPSVAQPEASPGAVSITQGSNGRPVVNLSLGGLKDAWARRRAKKEAERAQAPAGAEAMSESPTP